MSDKKPMKLESISQSWSISGQPASALLNITPEDALNAAQAALFEVERRKKLVKSGDMHFQVLRSVEEAEMTLEYARLTLIKMTRIHDQHIINQLIRGELPLEWALAMPTEGDSE